MKSFKDHMTEANTKLRWVKKPDGYGAGNKKVFKHVTSDGKFEIRLAGMDSMKFNRDGSIKVLPTLFDKSGSQPKHPVIAYKNVGQAKSEAQRWADTHWNK